MSHPMNAHRAHKVEKERVHHIAHRASGGGVHADEKADMAMLKRVVKKTAMKVHGEKPHHRADRAHRAHGGKVKGKKGQTNVNVIIAPQGGHQAGLAGAGMPPMAAAPPPAAAMPHPMMPPPGAGGPPGMPPGMPPPGMHKRGGRAYATGGGVKSGAAWEEGKKAGTKVQHNESGKTANQKDQPGQLHRGKVITYATGGAIEHPAKGGMAPKLEGGAGGGEARLEKPHRIIRKGVKSH